MDEAIRALRADPASAELVRDAYLGRDVAESIERFSRSAEFAEAVALIGSPLVGATIVDLGAGIGLASAGFRRLGAGRVIAIFQLRLNALFPVAISPDVPFSFWRRGSSVDQGRNS